MSEIRQEYRYNCGHAEHHDPTQAVVSIELCDACNRDLGVVGWVIDESRPYGERVVRRGTVRLGDVELQPLAAEALMGVADEPSEGCG